MPDRWQMIGNWVRYSLAVIWISGGLVACSTLEEPTQTDDVAAGYTVRRGDTLAAIARQAGITYQELARWNHLDPPYVIYPGQRLRLSSGNSAMTPNTERAETALPAVSGLERGQWQWPLQGQRPAPPVRQAKGMLIPGRLGQPVLAVADGKVVYGGTGIVGYGHLLVIQHAQGYLSIYGHNRALLVGEGHRVRQGQVIAELGQLPDERSALYFEVRRQGRPVEPLDLLPPHE